MSCEWMQWDKTKFTRHLEERHRIQARKFLSLVNVTTFEFEENESHGTNCTLKKHILHNVGMFKLHDLVSTSYDMTS